MTEFSTILNILKRFFDRLLISTFHSTQCNKRLFCFCSIAYVISLGLQFQFLNNFYKIVSFSLYYCILLVLLEIKSLKKYSHESQIVTSCTIFPII